jgi:pyrroloquinoline quinone (PQQ) biosynthesis protein C
MPNALGKPPLADKSRVTEDKIEELKEENTLPNEEVKESLTSLQPTDPDNSSKAAQIDKRKVADRLATP